MKTIIATVFLIISTCVVAQNKIITLEKKKQIESYINHFEIKNQLMGNVSIFENGEELINETFGSKNNTDATKYTVGSITKMFTSVLFAKMYESSKIDFDEKLSNYFPEIPNSNKITIKHLLSHTSGLKDYVVKNDSLYFWLKEPVANQDIIQEIRRQGISFQPGDSLQYSNSAYYLLARILEQKNQKTYKEIVADNITIPLGLENTFAIDKYSKQLNVAKSYEKRNNQWNEMDEFYFPNTSGAGDIISNAYDLNKFLLAIFSEQIIKLSTLKKMLPIDGDWFGMGFMKVPFYKDIAFGHGGDTYGTHAVTSYNPKNKIAISYIINGENYPTNDFAIGLLSIIYDKDYKLPEFNEYVPEKRFYALYEGVYGAEDFPMNIKIYLEENELKAQADGQPFFTLSPKEKHVFSFVQAGIEIEFKPFENKFILRQSGQLFELKKL
ncbi:MAG: serine hydrolase [Flavobacteriaceae bacterium]|nr:MAG: serine hydrolase [Flavobacteriaceae bacterium]